MDTTWFNEERRKPNTLQIWGNATTMNLNNLILTNITNSPYYKGQLAELKTYHEVIDEIYFKVKHLEPWEKGSRRTSGQTGMCGGVRGVGAGGIISTAFCLLYKLFSLKLTRKQLNGLLNHTDSPYIRGLGFMYIRFTQLPADLWEWYEPYLNDPEEVDVRAGGGQVITIGEMVRLFLTKLDWFSSLFPRIPVPIQIGIDRELAALKHATSLEATPKKVEEPEASGSQMQSGKLSIDYFRGESSSSSRPRRSRSRSRSPRRLERRRDSSSPRDRRTGGSSRDRRSKSKSPKYSRNDSSHRHRHRDDRRRDRDHHRSK